jgi:hypothetical protein
VNEVEAIKSNLSYDPQSGDIFRFQLNGSTRQVGKVAFSHGYITFIFMGKSRLAHRVAWLLHYGEWPAGFIDHINGDRADNRIANLRDVSRSGNQRNQKLSSRNKSGVLGVHWSNKASKWVASIKLNGRQIHLGLFEEKFTAAEARHRADRLYGFHPNHGRPAPSSDQRAK